MALFKKKSQEQTKAEQPQQASQPAEAMANAPAHTTVEGNNVDWVILKPHFSEKSLLLSDKKVYVFEVHKDANKKQIAQAIKKIYKVEPVKINIARMPRKKTFSWKTRTQGRKAMVKKAYVYLSEKDSISFV